MICEMAVVGLFCPPYFDYEFSGSMSNGSYTYSIEVIISTISTLRVLQIIRIYEHYSIWLSPEAYDLGEKLNISPNLVYSLKSDLKFQSQYILVPILSLITLIMGYAIRNLERPYVSNTKSSLDFDYLTNGFWLTIVTMCTIGYGDGYPSTHLGRFIVIVTAIFSMIAISLYIFALNSATFFNKEQAKAYFLIKDFKQRENFKNEASNVIKKFFALKKIIGEKEKKKYLEKVFRATAEIKIKFYNFHGKVQKSSKYLPPNEMILQLEHKYRKDINFIKKEVIDIGYIGDRLEELMKDEEKIGVCIDEILDKQDYIQNLVEELEIDRPKKNNKLEVL